MLNKILAFLNLSTTKNSSNELNDLLNSDFSKMSQLHKFDKFLSTKYLNENGNLTEEKYKLVCLNIFLDYKQVFLSNMPLTTKYVEDISSKLIEEKETKYEINKIFDKDLSLTEVEYDFRMSALREIQEETKVYNPIDTSVSINKILEEDQDNYKKLDIARKIYQDFNNCGILADKLRKDKMHLPIVLELQNHRLETNDYKSLNKYLEEGNIDYYIHPNTKSSIWNPLINNENSIENLNLIKKFIGAANMASFGFRTSEKDEKENFLNIETKINYLELQKEMPITKLETSKNKKLKL